MIMSSFQIWVFSSVTPRYKLLRRNCITGHSVQAHNVLIREVLGLRHERQNVS
jgi:hypothetical protein